jgi:hypothetical protein
MRPRGVAQPWPPGHGGLRGTERKRAGDAPGGWLAWSQRLADRWGGERRQEAARLWVDAQGDPQLSLAVRVRAATALDPFHR